MTPPPYMRPQFPVPMECAALRVARRVFLSACPVELRQCRKEGLQGEVATPTRLPEP